MLLVASASSLSDAVRASAAYHALVRRLVMPGMRLLDPETAHGLGIRFAAAGLAPLDGDAADPILATRVFGIDFPNPVGLAAGFDKQVR